MEKYGYITIKYMSDIQKILNMDKESFNKIIKLFDNQIKMTDVNNIIFSLLQREFRFSNRNIITIFSRLKTLIENKNIEEINKELKKINEVLNINDILQKYKLDYNSFINGLINKKYVNILHEITDNYISIKRDKYIINNQEKIKRILNLKVSYEKNYLIKKLLKCDIYTIYSLIMELDKSCLSNEELELINDRELLIGFIKFQKNPSNYKGIDMNKLRFLNQIFLQLYLNKKLDYLGMNDENAKLIYDVKETDPEECLKIMAKLDVEKIKKILNSPLYDKLLRIMKKYHFLGWNDIFEPLLLKADLEFDSNSIIILINYYFEIDKKLKDIRLTNLINEINVFNISLNKCKYLLGKEDYYLFTSNPSPNASPFSKEERIEELIIRVKEALSRKYIPIPPINENILVNNKKMNVRINSFVDSINFTYGERTGSCMRI